MPPHFLYISAVIALPPASEGEVWSEELGVELDKAAALSRLYGRYAQAQLLFRRALHGRERAWGPDHPGTLASLENLANLIRDQVGELRVKGLERRGARGYLRLTRNPDEAPGSPSLCIHYTCVSVLADHL